MSNEKKTSVKSDLIRDLQGHFQDLKNQDVERICESIFKYLGNELAMGREIEIRQFGTIRVKKMPSRVGRNPKSGQVITVEEKNKVKWKSSKVLNSRINKSESNIEK